MNRYQREQRKLQAAHEVGQARAQQAQAQLAFNPTPLRCALKDYFGNRGTCTLHVLDKAEEAGLDKQTLRSEFHAPAAALDMLDVYRQTPPARRKHMSVDIPKQDRQRMMVALADRAGVEVPPGYAAP